LLDCWVAGWLDCSVAGLLDGWLLDCLIAGLLDGWIAGRLFSYYCAHTPFSNFHPESFRDKF